MIAFWGDNKGLTAKKSADCTILKHSDKAVKPKLFQSETLV